MELNNFRFNFIKALRKDKRLNNNTISTSVVFSAYNLSIESVAMIVRSKYFRHLAKQAGVKYTHAKKDSETAQSLRGARKTYKRMIECPEQVNLKVKVKPEHKHFLRLGVSKNSKGSELLVSRINFQNYKNYHSSVPEVLDHLFATYRDYFRNHAYLQALKIEEKARQPISIKAIKEKATKVWINGEDSTLAPQPSDKSNYVGVEVECVSQLNQSKLSQLLVDKAPGLVKYVRIGGDGSVRASEKYPHAFEFRIMAKQELIQGVIERFFGVLKGIISVNSSCGLHVHLDMRNRNYGQSYERLYTALPTLQSMVPKSRRGNSYCKINKDKKDWSKGGGDRYQAINPQAYRRYKTVEIRLHSATTNPIKVNNWIRLLTLIIDKRFDTNKKTGKPTEPQRSLNSLLSFFTKYEVPSDLRNYVTRRIAKFGKAEELKVPKELEPILNATGTDNATTEQDEADDLLTATA